MATDKLVDFDHVTDYISREAAIALTDQHCFETSYDAVWMEEELRKLPAADVVEVVRCKDCRFFHNGYDEKCCINHKGVVVTDENGFCHHAERRDEDG